MLKIILTILLVSVFIIIPATTGSKEEVVLSEVDKTEVKSEEVKIEEIKPKEVLPKIKVKSTEVYKTEMSSEEKIAFEDYMDDIFGEKSEIATAVLKHESSLNLEAKHYNCRYTNPKTGKLYSTTCKKGDIAKAWSVDCGIAQVNIKGKICPSKLMTLEGNMVAVREIYKNQGLSAWVSYTTGRYKRFLPI